MGYSAASGWKEISLTGEELDTFSQLITTALGLVAALAWNTAIRSLFTETVGEAGDKLVEQLF